MGSAGNMVGLAVNMPGGSSAPTAGRVSRGEKKSEEARYGVGQKGH